MATPAAKKSASPRELERAREIRAALLTDGWQPWPYTDASDPRGADLLEANKARYFDTRLEYGPLPEMFVVNHELWYRSLAYRPGSETTQPPTYTEPSPPPQPPTPPPPPPAPGSPLTSEKIAAFEAEYQRRVATFDAEHTARYGVSIFSSAVPESARQGELTRIRTATANALGYSVQPGQTAPPPPPPPPPPEPTAPFGTAPSGIPLFSKPYTPDYYFDRDKGVTIRNNWMNPPKSAQEALQRMGWARPALIPRYGPGGTTYTASYAGIVNDSPYAPRDRVTNTGRQNALVLAALLTLDGWIRTGQANENPQFVSPFEKDRLRWEPTGANHTYEQWRR